MSIHGEFNAKLPVIGYCMFAGDGRWHIWYQPEETNSEDPELVRYHMWCGYFKIRRFDNLEDCGLATKVFDPKDICPDCLASIDEYCERVHKGERSEMPRSLSAFVDAIKASRDNTDLTNPGT